jgi:hypothetical protein
MNGIHGQLIFLGDIWIAMMAEAKKEVEISEEEKPWSVMESGLKKWKANKIAHFLIAGAIADLIQSTNNIWCGIRREGPAAGCH